MSVIIGMFRELARLGVSRAAAFFYAVAVGVAVSVAVAVRVEPEYEATIWKTPVLPAVVVQTCLRRLLLYEQVTVVTGVPFCSAVSVAELVRFSVAPFDAALTVKF